MGCAAGVEDEALRLVDCLQHRLRGVARQVAKAKRPKVLSLEGLQPLVLGKLSITPKSTALPHSGELAAAIVCRACRMQMEVMI